MRCWNCQSETHGQLLCPACSKIAQRAPGATHFDLFGLPPRHALDRDALEKQFRELSLKVHPDRFAHADPKERRLSLEQTAALNEAYKTLRDPVKRAFYLLKLRGIDLDREDQGHLRGMPPDFLEEVLELREALAEADLGQAQKMAVEVDRKKKVALAEAIEQLDAVDREGEAGSGALQQASHALARVRYFDRFLEQVSAMEEEAL